MEGSYDVIEHGLSGNGRYLFFVVWASDFDADLVNPGKPNWAHLSLSNPAGT